jgi:hypothetical protein
MCLLFVHPEAFITASLLTEEKVAERGMEQFNRRVFLFWNVKDRT